MAASKIKKKSTIVTHPGLQHSHQLAWALHEKNILQKFYSGVPVLSEFPDSPRWLYRPYLKRIKKVAIPSVYMSNPFFFQIILRVSKLLPDYINHADLTHRIFHLFDWWMSRKIKRLKPKVVVAYENSAYHTFKVAKLIGAKCILDASSLHFTAQSRYLNIKSTPYLKEINRRKHEEIVSADLIITCSPFARDSYLEAGVPKYKVRSVLLGATLPDHIGCWSPHDGPLRFIFAGALSYTKGVDLLLTAFNRLSNEQYSYEIVFVGGASDPGWVEKINKTPYARYVNGVPQKQLYEMLVQADCLILPSRFDSYGMVAAEAIACGTPIIVSSRTGAKAIVEDFPKSGWIIECTETSIYECLKDRIQNPSSIFAARHYAAEASRHFTWQSYRERVGDLIYKWATYDL